MTCQDLHVKRDMLKEICQDWLAISGMWLLTLSLSGTVMGHYDKLGKAMTCYLRFYDIRSSFWYMLYYSARLAIFVFIFGPLSHIHINLFILSVSIHMKICIGSSSYLSVNFSFLCYSFQLHLLIFISPSSSVGLFICTASTIS